MNFYSLLTDLLIYQEYFKNLNNKPCLALLLLCFFVLPTSTRAQDFRYAKGLHNPLSLGGNVDAASIKADNLGNTYVVGSFFGTADFDPGADTASLTSAGASDIFIAKYDPSGKYVYAKAVGGVGYEYGFGIVADLSGNVYVTGCFGATWSIDLSSGVVDNFKGRSDFDPGPGTAILTSASPEGGIFIAKYDASGKYVFARSMRSADGNRNKNYGNAIALDGQGNVVVTGSFGGAVDFDPGKGTTSMTSPKSSRDIFIAKYTAAGNFIYVKTTGGTQSHTGRVTGIAIDGSDRIWITGSFTGQLNFNTGDGPIITFASRQEDVFIARYTTLGDCLFAKVPVGSGLENARGIALDALGNAFITGVFQNTVDFDAGAGTASLTSAGVSDGFIAKYDPSGNCKYTIAIGGTGADTANTIAVDAMGNLYVTGTFQGTADFDPGAHISNLTSAGMNDIFVAKYDPSGNYVYAKAAGGTSADRGCGITVDASGRVYVAGTFHGTADFDPGRDSAMLTIGGVASNAFICSLDKTGGYAWATQLGTFNGYEDFADGGSGIAVDALGNTYVTGNFRGTVDFDPGIGVANLSSAGSADIFLAKYDPLGNYIYAKAIGGTGWDGSSGIAADVSGNVYLTGYFEGIVDFDPGIGTANLTSAGSSDIFVAKYDDSGNLIYSKAIGGVGYDYSSGIATDLSGNVYLTGTFYGTADFDPGAGTASLTSAGVSDIFIARYDASGNYVYAKALGGFGYDYSRSIAADGLGNVYITGSFERAVDFDPGTSKATLTSKGADDIFMAKYDPTGRYVYAKAMGEKGYEYGFGIAADFWGNTYVTGIFQRAVDFDPGAGTATLTSNKGSIGSYDFFIARYDASGNYVWAKSVGGAGSDESHSVVADRSGNIYISGTFEGTVDFDPGAGADTLTSAGIADIFVAKYDPSGNYVYARAMGGKENEYGGRITTDFSGNVYVTGSFRLTADFDPGGTSNSILNSNNSSDIFIAKFGPVKVRPVLHLSLRAVAISNKEAVEVNWSTTSQTNNTSFEVERSKDAIQFEAIGRMPGCFACTGTQYYQSYDYAPYNGLSYYRIKQVGNDNSVFISPVATIEIEKLTNTTLHVYPGITDGACRLVIKNNHDKKQVAIRLLKAGGGLVNEQTVWLADGDNTFQYNLSNQTPGVYYFSVADTKNAAVAIVMVIKK